VHLTAEVMVWVRNRLSCLIELHITARLNQHFRYITRSLPIHIQPLEVQSSFKRAVFLRLHHHQGPYLLLPVDSTPTYRVPVFSPSPASCATRSCIIVRVCSSFRVCRYHHFVYVGAYTFALDQRKAARWRPHLLDLRFVVGYPEEVVKQHICSEEHRGDVATWLLRVFEGREVAGDELDGWRAKK
jgi:hypothetical protein